MRVIVRDSRETSIRVEVARGSGRAKVETGLDALVRRQRAGDTAPAGAPRARRVA